MVALICGTLAIVLAFGGMYLKQQELLATNAAEAAEYTPAPIPEPADPTLIAAVGDSFTGGSDMGGYKEANWTEVLAGQLATDTTGIVSTETGLGGSGYVNRGPNGGVFGEVISDAFNENTDVAILFGSINDRLQPLPAVEAAASAAMEQTKAAAPTADLVVIGPAWMRPEIPAEISAIRDTIEALANKKGATFIDPLEERWFLDDPELIGADGTHPTDEGHAYMADRIAPHLAPLINN